MEYSLIHLIADRQALNPNSLREQILKQPIIGPSGNHSARLWRVAENAEVSADHDKHSNRLLHLMSRVGVLCRGLAADLRTGHISQDEAAIIMDQVADLGDLSFEQSRGLEDLIPMS